MLRPPDEASARFTDVVERFRATGVLVETGQFQAMMDVALVNDGPVTLVLDSGGPASEPAAGKERIAKQQVTA